MTSHKNYLRLGIFVLCATALLIMGVILLGVGSAFKHYVVAETYFADSVEGLDVGAAVTYRGVKIGKVGAVRLGKPTYEPGASTTGPLTSMPVTRSDAIGRYIVIELDIDPQSLPKASLNEMRDMLAEQVRIGMRVRLASSLTGPSHIEVDYLDPASYPPIAISWVPEHLYIPSAPSSTRRIVSAVERIATQLEEANVGQLVRHADELIRQANAAVRDIKTEHISEEAIALLRNARSASDQVNKLISNPVLEKTINDIGAIAGSAKDAVGGKDGNLQTMLAELRRASTHLKETSERANQLLHDEQLEKAIAGMSAASQNAGPAMADLRQMTRRLNLLMSEQTEALADIIANLRDITANANAVTQDASQNPSRLLFGEPPRKTQVRTKP